MSTDRWRMVKGLFQRALSLPPSEWDDYLDRVCVGDADLRTSVAELLSEHQNDSGLLGGEKSAWSREIVRDARSPASSRPSETAETRSDSDEVTADLARALRERLDK